MKAILYLLLSFAVFISGFNDVIIPRLTGDVLYQNCQNVTIGGQAVNDACVVLSEASDCGLNVALTVSGQQVLSENMDLELTPQVCGSYTQSGITCQLCVTVQLDHNNNTQRCVVVTPKCSGIPLSPIDGGCFPESTLDGIIQCQDQKCPNDCSGHGTCLNGECQCESTFYGDDCSYTGELFFYCNRVDEVAGNLCVRVIFENCSIGVAMVLEGGGTEVSLYEQQYPISQFKQVFQEGQCATVGGGVCSACLTWDNLVLTERNASGCGSVAISCPGISNEYQIGCFEDDNIVPECFGTCPNNCSGADHGYCNNGICKCNGGWGGDDCSVISGCPGDCSGHGTCKPGRVCGCDQGYAGTDCSIVKPSSSSSSTTTGSSTGSSNSNKVKIAAVVIPIVVVIVGAIVFALWYTRRNRKLTPQFTQLDLITAEDDDDDEGLRSD